MTDLLLEGHDRTLSQTHAIQQLIDLKSFNLRFGSFVNFDVTSTSQNSAQLWDDVRFYWPICRIGPVLAFSLVVGLTLVASPTYIYYTRLTYL